MKKVRLAETGQKLFGVVRNLFVTMMVIIMVLGLLQKVPDSQMVKIAVGFMGIVFLALIATVAENLFENFSARLKR